MRVDRRGFLGAIVAGIVAKVVTPGGAIEKVVPLCPDNRPTIAAEAMKPIPGATLWMNERQLRMYLEFVNGAPVKGPLMSTRAVWDETSIRSLTRGPATWRRFPRA